MPPMTMLLSSSSSSSSSLASLLWLRAAAPLRKKGLARHLSSTPSFAQLFRKSVDNAPLTAGDVVQGHIVGAFRPKSTSSRFYIVDYGLKAEAPFTARELPGMSSVGDAVSMPLVELEDDFNEPVFDQNRTTELPAIQAERFSLLMRKMPDADVRLLYGRFSRFNRGGATAKVLGVDAFVPRHHVLVLQRPILGSFYPFYLMSLQSDKLSANAKSMNVFPVVSSYGGIIFCLANLVGFDSAWEQSGGGHAKERLAYLRLLTKILMHKNAAIRRILPLHSQSSSPPGRRRQDGEVGHRRRSSRRVDSVTGDTAWLNELPRSNWASSSKDRVSSVIPRHRDGGDADGNQNRRRRTDHTGRHPRRQNDRFSRHRDEDSEDGGY